VQGLDPAAVPASATGQVVSAPAAAEWTLTRSSYPAVAYQEVCVWHVIGILCLVDELHRQCAANIASPQGLQCHLSKVQTPCIIWLGITFIQQITLY
jgi:hypothetical protein